MPTIWGLPLSDDGVKVNRILEIEDWSDAQDRMPATATALDWDFEFI
jgi:hypothetical protein